MNNLLSKATILSAFPVALRRDRAASMMADITAEILEARMAEIARLAIYTRIDELPEDLLDILAYDFKVDWWDADYSVDEKRRVLKDSWRVHRLLGTRYAVETALGNVFPGAIVQEWFDYGGKPYCFRVTLPVTDDGISAERQRRVLSRAWFYKNLRSHLDALTLKTETSGRICVGAYAETGVAMEVWPETTETATMPDVKIGAGVLPQTAATVRSWPGVTERVEMSAGASSAVVEMNTTIEIYPEV